MYWKDMVARVLVLAALPAIAVVFAIIVIIGKVELEKLVDDRL